MISTLFSNNLVAWLIQVSAIAVFGCLLPFAFRIRHARSQLAFYHAVLIACIVFPLIEPVRHPLAIVTSVTGPHVGQIHSGLTWSAIAVWVIVGGFVARIAWLAAGLRQIRKFRAAATPLYPIPESIRHARLLTHADAVFYVSQKVDGPATLGHVDPVVMLPRSFLSLSQDAQLSIACHELLHVVRNDWLVTLCEEVIGAAFWFNPAMMWLLAQTKLSREKCVDSEVVELTAARTPYVRALLDMAESTKDLKMMPAAPFFTEGHLAQRVRTLLTEKKGSLTRLFISYVSMTCLLVVVGWTTMLFFPLVGDAQSVATSPVFHNPPDLYAWTSQKEPVRSNSSTSATPGVFEYQTIRRPNENTLSESNKGTALVVDAQRLIAIQSEGSEFEMKFVPPPFPPGPPGFSAGIAVRAIRPGQKVTPEEIARIQAELGSRAFIEVTQAPDGTVQRVTILGRRFLDENNNVLFNVHTGAGESHPAVPTDTDRIN